MKALLLEHFWLLLGIGVVASIAAFYLAVQRRTKACLLAAKIVPAVFVILLVLNWFVVTDREAVKIALDQLIAACEAGDTKALGALIDDQFSATGMSKRQFLDAVAPVFTQLKIENVYLQGLENNPATAPAPAVVRFTAWADIVGNTGGKYGKVQSAWKLTFQNRDNTWLLYDVQPISVNFQPINDVRQVIRSAESVR